MARIDKFLWHARFFKSRTLAAASVSDGRIRVNGEHCAKPATTLKAGDVLTINTGGRVLIVKVLNFGVRRGPATEARLLYDDLTPPVPKSDEAGKDESPSPHRKPTKQERRALTTLKTKHFDA
ncbi:MAG: RNA-binding S4 domain-containing protein [Micropepsaceae bacterium]